MDDPRYESVVPDLSSSFRCFHRVCADLSVDHPWHFHPQYELSWVMRSSGFRYVGNYIEPYVPDEVVLYGPDLPHCSRNDAGSPDGAMVEYITLQFDPACLGAGFLDLPEAGAIRRMMQDAARAVMFEPAAATIVGGHLRRLVEATGMTRLVTLIDTLNLLSEVGRRTLVSDSYAADVTVDRRLVDRLNRVQRYIDAHFRGFVSQADIAGELDLSPSAFSKFVRAATGRTFMSIVQMARINEACRLLAHSDERITDVALECGYQHTSHFDRCFRDLKGLSPSAYRDRARRLDANAAAPVRHAA